MDGVDYWIWERLEVVQPRIVIAEYNALFGPSAKVTVPYREDYSRSEAHSSCLLFGASLGALHDLAISKGYRLVGTNTAGNNAFFVRDDVAGSLPGLSPESAFQPSRFREARNDSGELAYLSFEQGQQCIASSLVHDLEQCGECPLNQVAAWRTLPS